MGYEKCDSRPIWPHVSETGYKIGLPQLPPTTSTKSPSVGSKGESRHGFPIRSVSGSFPSGWQDILHRLVGIGQFIVHDRQVSDDFVVLLCFEKINRQYIYEQQRRTKSHLSPKTFVSRIKMVTCVRGQHPAGTLQFSPRLPSWPKEEGYGKMGRKGEQEGKWEGWKGVEEVKKGRKRRMKRRGVPSFVYIRR